jgi:glycosyltransferase involved in cell wall biosynthesis
MVESKVWFKKMDIKRMDVKVSVVVPTYNRPALIKKCLEGLVQQNFNPDAYEIIVVTDGPDVRTSSIVNAYKNKCNRQVHCYSLPVKKGPAAARNKGWRSAKGELILFTDDDCVPSAKWVLGFWKAYETMQTNRIAFTGKILVPHKKPPTDHERNTIALEEADFVTANCAVSKAMLEHIGGFDEAFKMAWREDSDLEFKLLNAGVNIPHVEDAVVEHPIREAPWGISLKEQRKSMFNALLFKKYPQLYRNRINKRPVLLYYGMVLLLFICLTALLLDAKTVAVGSFLGWFILVTYFITKRLSGASLAFKHVIEMIVTSMFIPFLSVFWTLYGSYKYKVLFL